MNTWNTTGKFLSVQVLNIFKCWTNRVDSIVEPVQNKNHYFSLKHTLLGSATFCSTTFGRITFGSATSGNATLGSATFGIAHLVAQHLVAQHLVAQHLVAQH